MNYILFAPSPGAFSFKYEDGCVQELFRHAETKEKDPWIILSDEQYDFDGIVMLYKNSDMEYKKRVLGENYESIINNFARENGIDAGRVVILEILGKNQTINKTENGNL
jgi:hypothetical protein